MTSVAALRSRASRLWLADLTDPVAMRRLRARVIWVLALLAIVAQVGSWAGQPLPAGIDRGVLVALTAVLATTVVVAAWRGDRLGDVGFLALIIGNQVSAVVSVSLTSGGDHTSQATVSVMTATLMGALFCGRRRHVAVEVASAVALLIATARAGMPTATAASDMVAGTFTVIAVSAVVRLLRDLAIVAVDGARRGEVTDPLTGLANRRGLERAGGRYWTEHARAGERVAVLVIDVDHFKTINDSQGHAEGDAVLRRLGELVSASLRAGDVAVRLGGEEFLVLASIQPGQGQLVAERIRRSVETEMSPVTVSIGVHEVLPDSQDALPTSLWSVVSRADQALYAAKNAGRNRVVLTD